MFERYIGIDISKNWFDVNIDKKVHRILQKDSAEFIKKHSSDLANSLCVMESTGGYEMPLAQALARKGVTVHIAHPNQVVAFMRAKCRLAKTDAIDARLLSEFGAFLKPEQIRRPPSEFQVRLANLSAHVTQIKEMIVQESCRANHPNKSDSFVSRSSQKIMKTLETELEACEKEMMALINSNPQLKRSFDVLVSMPGVGRSSALCILSDLDEIGQLSKKQIAALVGVAPVTNESGMKRGQSRIQYGRANVRKALYMAALVACQHNPVMKIFYQKLVSKGKPKKVGIIAVLRRMLVILNAMIKTDTLWQAKHD